MKSNVYQFPGKQVQEQTAAPPARTLNKEQRERMAAASRQINAAFAGPAAAARAAGATAIGKQPVFGPYKMPILYDKGEVYNRLITILTSTYNRLNREYNIASIDPASIVLLSDNPKVPNIPMLPDTKC